MDLVDIVGEELDRGNDSFCSSGLIGVVVVKGFESIGSFVVLINGAVELELTD